MEKKWQSEFMAVWRMWWSGGELSFTTLWEVWNSHLGPLLILLLPKPCVDVQLLQTAQSRVYMSCSCFLQTTNESWHNLCERNNSSAPGFKLKTSGWRDRAASSSGAAPSCWPSCGGPAAERQRALVWPAPTRTTCGLWSGGHHGQDSSLHPPGSCTGTQRDRDIKERWLNTRTDRPILL